VENPAAAMLLCSASWTHTLSSLLDGEAGRSFSVITSVSPISGDSVRVAFPFSAIVGQEQMKLALLIATVDPSVGGVLVLGDRGTGKSTVVRALPALLPGMKAVEGCRYGCDPAANGSRCDECRDRAARLTRGKLPVTDKPVPVIDLPLGATEDRVVGALDIEKALRNGEKAFEPGLLARAHRGFLYVDEVNLLEDHLVDLLLDVAQTGENVVERDGVSVRHPARFVLVGSGNPEEGDLRPQLLDRFGLSVEVRTSDDVAQRVEVIRRRDAYERDGEAFVEKWGEADAAVRTKILAARKRLPNVQVPDAVLQKAVQLCVELGTDGVRGELTLLRAARAAAALDGIKTVTDTQVKAVAPMALRHRLRRNVLDEGGSGTRVARAIVTIYGAA
jgi:magnesium chelatase subunit I